MHKLRDGSDLKIAFQKKIYILLFFILIVTALIAPISSITHIPNLADFVNHLALIIQAKLSLAEGQFPIRVSPVELFGYRYPYFQFYSPTTYTFAGLIYLFLFSNPLIAFKLTLWLGLLCGGIYMYRLSFWFVKSEVAALLSGGVYLFAPYMIIITDHLGSLNEVVAMGLLPAALYYSLVYYFKPHRTSTFLVLSLFWYLIITIHIITFVYTVLFLVAFLLLLTFKNRGHWRSFASVMISIGFACLLAMWFLVPVLLMEKYFYLSGTYTDGEFFRQHRPLLSQLLFPAASLTSGYKKSALLTIHPSIGIPILLGASVAFYGFLNRYSSGNKRADYLQPYLLILFLFSFLFAWSPFNFWQWLPHPLLVGQHCWRYLDQLIWVGTLLFAWSICWLFQKKFQALHLVIGILLIAISSNSWFPVLENYNYKLKEFIQNPHVIYNGDSYLLNYQKYPTLVSRTDSLQLSGKHFLRLNAPLTLKAELLKDNRFPELQLISSIPTEVAKQNYHLIAVQNHKVLAATSLNEGQMDWHVPLAKLNPNDIYFELQKDGKRQPNVNIPIEKILLTGFLNSAEVLSAKEMQKHCQQIKNQTICKVMVQDNIKLIELPIFYYPHLLTVSVNGKSVPYESVIFQGFLFMTIRPDAGYNQIQVEFTGLKWANFSSWMGWSLWILLFMFVIFKKCRSH